MGRILNASCDCMRREVKVEIKTDSTASDQDKRAYIEVIAEITGKLSVLEWDDPHRLFTQTLDAMTRDSQRWLDTGWKAPNGDTTPIERAIVVLSQDMIVLLGHAHNLGLEHDLLQELLWQAEKAVDCHVIEDMTHRAYFLKVDPSEGGEIE